MIEAGILARLASDPAVSPLLRRRIYIGMAPQDTAYPYLTLSPSSTEHMHSNDGPSGLAKRTIELEIWDDNYARAVRISEAIRLSLDGYTGTLGDSTCHVAWLENEGHRSALAIEGGETVVHLWTMGFVVHYETSRPSFVTA